MKKNIFKFILAFSIIAICFAILIFRSQTKKVNKLEAQKVVISYLDSLSKKDLNGIKEASTPKWSENFTNDSIDTLDKTLKSAKLLNSEIKETDKNRILIDANVELICYDDSSPIGDWIPGKSISEKSFELIKVDGNWKINDWSSY